MELAEKKADVLIEALTWIRQFRGKVTVIKLGGSVMEDEQHLRHLLLDIVFMETVGMKPVVVHGGGAAISRAMAAAGLQPHFVQGRRYTDGATLEIVEHVLAGEMNQQLADQIVDLGGKAQPLNFHTTNVLFGERIDLEGENGQRIDLGHVGRVTRVDRATIENLSSQGIVPVIPSMCLTAEGRKLNVNADTAATAVAEALQAEKLVCLSDVNGVRSNRNDPDSLMHSLTADQARAMIASGAIEAGMIPKVESCLETLEHGVRKIHIIDGRLRHSLLLEVYTSKGVGTEILKNGTGGGGLGARG
ncbi:MAG: acetylglutamate kinase [Thermoguttaceae bacterium]